jgi:hypothetical protein
LIAPKKGQKKHASGEIAFALTVIKGRFENKKILIMAKKKRPFLLER